MDKKYSEWSKPKRIKPEQLADKNPKQRKAIKDSYKQAKKDRKAERAKIREAKLAKKLSAKKSKSLKRPKSSKVHHHASSKLRLNQLNTTKTTVKPKAQKRQKKPASKPIFNLRKFINYLNSAHTNTSGYKLPRIPKNKLLPSKMKPPPEKRQKFQTVNNPECKNDRIVKKYFWRRTGAYMEAKRQATRSKTSRIQQNGFKVVQDTSTKELLIPWWENYGSRSSFEVDENNNLVKNPSFQNLRVKHGLIARRLHMINKNCRVIGPHVLLKGFWDPKITKVGIFRNGKFYSKNDSSIKNDNTKRYKFFKSSHGINHARFNKKPGKTLTTHMDKTGHRINFPIPTFSPQDRQRMVNKQNDPYFYENFDRFYKKDPNYEIADINKMEECLAKLSKATLSKNDAYREKSEKEREVMVEEERMAEKVEEEMMKARRFQQNLQSQGYTFKQDYRYSSGSMF
jgi:hypothetical protein